LTELARTPLAALHRRLGARMVPFAGYEMPLNYPPGILTEHRHCRAAAGLFDVSHMGQVALWPRSGRIDDAAAALERLVPMDILGLKPDRQRYALFTGEAGGILDDLMVANRGDHLFLVVNAACKAEDVAHLEAKLAQQCRVETLEGRALIALQGPEAERVLAAHAPEVVEMRFMDSRAVTLGGAAALVSRSGYTGEDGFEISLPDDAAEAMAEMLLADAAVEAIGLGARDSLRLEAGLCLYGQDIDSTTTPVEAALEWAIQKARRPGGARAGGFPGAERILDELDRGARRRRVGLQPEGRAPIREGAPLFAAAESDERIGAVTSGVFGPSLGAPVAMGYVATELAAPGTVISAGLRGRRVAVAVVETPFVAHRYKR